MSLSGFSRRLRTTALAVALVVGAALLAPPVVLPLATVPAGPAPCCCGSEGASCPCALLRAGGCGDGLCSLDDAPAEEGKDSAEPPPVLRLDQPTGPVALATPDAGDGLAALAGRRTDPPALPPETPPPR